MAAVVAVLGLGCGDAVAPPEPTTVTVSPSAVELTALESTAQLRAEIRDQHGQVMNVPWSVWSSGSAQVARVDSAGLVTAVANGATAVTASVGGVSGSAGVTVAQKVSSVSVSPSADTVPIGDTLRLAAEARDANGNVVGGAAFLWTTADPQVAVVDNTGLVKAVGDGRVEVTATSSGVAGRAVLAVQAARPDDVEVTPDTVAFTALGQTARLTAEVRDQGGNVMAEVSVTWASCDTAVATVDSAGTATAVGPGAAVVTATAGGVSAEAVVVVRQVVRSLSLSPGEVTVGVADTVRLSAEAMDENGHAVAEPALAWSSSDTSVAAVDSAGLVLGVGIGAATITAAARAVEASSEVTVDNPDRAALVALYNATDGPNWVNSENWLTDAPLGDWYGVDTGEHGRVTRLYLGAGYDREERLSVSANGLKGAIPPELGNLAKLKLLWLGWNDLTGPIPPELGHLAELEQLDLADNHLTGPIPPELGRLSKLELLDILQNGLTGPIPPELGSLAGLKALELASNGLTGSIPPELGSLHKLERLAIYQNGLTGPIPPALGSLGGLKALHLANNGLTGSIPPELGSLTELWELSLYSNDLTGPIPPELGSLTKLRFLGLSHNDLTGPIPPELGSLTELLELSLVSNGLTGAIPPELGRLINLLDMDFRENGLTGTIPSELGNLSKLLRLDLRENGLTGAIPSELGNLSKLLRLDLRENGLTGAIPSELGNLSKLLWLDLRENGLTGAIPSELGNLSKLLRLELGENGLTGAIPSELGNLVNLQWLDLRQNDLTDPIPPELGRLTELQELHLSSNGLTGPLPPELGSLAKLERLWIFSNDLTGAIPRTFLKMQSLRLLYGRTSGLCLPGISEFVEWAGWTEAGSGRVVVPFCNLADQRVLGILHAGTDGRRWRTSDGWLGGPVLGEWHGVQADSLGRVTALRLSDNGLSGGLPVSLGLLTRLTRIWVDGNNGLAGRLPRSLTQLNLEELAYGGTGLCVPDDHDFTTWLAGLRTHLGTGRQCGPFTERDALLALHASTGGPSWREDRNWGSDEPLRRWHGVEVDGEGRVVGLNLRFNGLRGTIPAELASLARLKRLDLRANRFFTGEIPPEVGSLTALEHLDLGWNLLAGTIPPELGNLAKLRHLDLGANNLRGPIPGQLGNLTALEYLDLGWSILSGPIPRELGKLAKLKHLDLGRNAMASAVPPELGRLTALEHLDLREVVTGAIPRELGNLVNLEYLNLSSDDFRHAAGRFLVGTIPRELGNLVKLERLYLSSNRLVGGVPHEFGRMSALRELELAHNNQMAGKLPNSLTNLRLERLQAGGTDLCAPRDAAFDNWLDALPEWWIGRCGGAMAYLVQAVQSRTHPVPLVAGEAALLRVFVTATEEASAGMPPVRARFYLNGAERHVADIPGQPDPIPTVIEEGRLSRSANAEIPGHVVRPGLEMVVEIDPDGTLDPGLGVTQRIPDAGRMAVPVVEMPSLNLTVVPFLWTSDPDSSIIDTAIGMAADPHGHPLLKAARTLLPVGALQVRAHDPVATASSDAIDMLLQTEAMRVMEAGGGHYKGMMAPMLTQGVIGVAYKPGRSSFSRPDDDVIAHELGHNMNLSHAPCGSIIWNVDPFFPYLDGSVGAWGYDFAKAGLVSPDTPDLMSYCEPVGISDYHFVTAMRFRLSDHDFAGTRVAASPTRSLLLWGGVDPDGQPFLNPAFVVDAPPALPDSTGDHAVTGQSADGRELFSLSFTMPEVASEEDLGSSFVFALPVRPEWAGALASITLSGPEGSATLNADSDLPMAILRDPRSGQVRGFLRDVADPSSVQADALAGAAPGTTLEVLFSRGLPARADWQP